MAMGKFSGSSRGPLATTPITKNSHSYDGTVEAGYANTKDRSEYEVAGESLDESMRDLGLVIDELALRLIPVMQPGPKGDCPDKPEEAPNDSRIVRHLLDQANRARGYKDRIKKLLEAMQI
jgi:hypothetical protein